ncbi:hypothetical protein GGX14DRAFT_404343 [Mycena pura]|uniref:F-box domain-containing protein n=1 Tax=Mycena pura TaxID=153505 RepID=A0AAD6UW77_9AGAR|nr:hypothetical protein GGX14DRAFT_404343 [Mycena pura]
MYALQEELRRDRYDTHLGFTHGMQQKLLPIALILFAPIRRLPSEILLEIFPEAFAFERPPPYHLDEELERLANGRLLTLSRVCVRWRSIVIGTPMLWKVFQLNSILWSTSSGLEKTMQILADGLERSLQISDHLSLPPPTDLFDLLARHSERWEVAQITSSIKDIDLSVLKGKLPIFRYFLFSLGSSKSPEPLATQVLNLSLLDNITIPFEQLNLLACEGSGPASVARAISVMSKLRRGAGFHLQFFNRKQVDPNQPIPLDVPPTMSTISWLSWRIVGGTYPRHSSHALREFLDSLTLPNLAELRLTCDRYSRQKLAWPHQEFLDLCARSGLERCLTVLRISDVFITEEDLIQLLSRLESLEHLEIADKEGQGTDLLLVTDTFLRAIALPSPSSDTQHPIPRLRHFACASKMGFTVDVFIDFVASRLERRSPENPLSIDVRPPPDNGTVLHRAAPVHVALEQLVARSKRRLRYEYGT